MTKITKAPKRELFRTAPERGLPSTARVDRDKRIIYGARAMQLGKLSEGDARPWKVDRVTLEQLVELTAGREIGVKMRFSHPNASRDGLGRHVGRARNARLVDEGGMLHVAVDTHLNAKGGPRTQERWSTCSTSQRKRQRTSASQSRAASMATRWSDRSLTKTA